VGRVRVIKKMWQDLGRVARFGLIAGIVCILAVTVTVGYWLLHTEYQVLFADLTPQDAAAMAAELERQKIPFSVSEHGAGGTTAILVDKNDVHKTRLKLMGKDIPLHGAVGFELFNNSDFGMTEFSQKINYQRALQGELTRTILSLSEVRDARVLLAMPEQGLFKQNASKSKASITVTLKQGKALRPEQVGGIQRLVSAAVPGIATEDVTIIDQSGVALTRAAGDGDGDASSARLELKKDTENYLSRKASRVLERALGAGQALASVDVMLNMDRVQTTTEDVVAAPGKPGQAQTGVVVRERASAREVGAPLSARTGGEAAGGLAGSSQREIEYAVGRRVEQVMSQPGSIRRIQVVAVVKKALDPNQQEQIRKMVAASVGASIERGDTVVVQTMDAISAPASVAGVAGAPRPDGETATSQEEVARAMPGRADEARTGGKSTSPRVNVTVIGLGLLSSLVAILGLWLARLLRQRRGIVAAQPSQAASLSEAQRRAALAQVQAWMRGGEAGPANGGLS
jgi:flagellar M-ring protein FliF